MFRRSRLWVLMVVMTSVECRRNPVHNDDFGAAKPQEIQRNQDYFAAQAAKMASSRASRSLRGSRTAARHERVLPQKRERHAPGEHNHPHHHEQ
ncbi:hypothetical protein M885DRAFT_505347 [Pelagophyceae sp. CCMP2097]|nr:hypothetical protein M885DRAFT_505347 [Pelagophyceae sp. CCMP2097]